MYRNKIFGDNSNGDKMDENNELLMYIYKNADMGVKSTTKLIRLLNTRDNKIKKVVEGELKGYENFLKRAKPLLKKQYQQCMIDNSYVSGDTLILELQKFLHQLPWIWNL